MAIGGAGGFLPLLRTLPVGGGGGGLRRVSRSVTRQRPVGKGARNHTPNRKAERSPDPLHPHLSRGLSRPGSPARCREKPGRRSGENGIRGFAAPAVPEPGPWAGARCEPVALAPAPSPKHPSPDLHPPYIWFAARSQGWQAKGCSFARSPLQDASARTPELHHVRILVPTRAPLLPRFVGSFAQRVD